jgi:hypothetical protein
MELVSRVIYKQESSISFFWGKRKFYSWVRFPWTCAGFNFFFWDDLKPIAHNGRSLISNSRQGKDESISPQLFTVACNYHVPRLPHITTWIRAPTKCAMQLIWSPWCLVDTAWRGSNEHGKLPEKIQRCGQRFPDASQSEASNMVIKTSRT